MEWTLLAAGVLILIGVALALWNCFSVLFEESPEEYTGHKLFRYVALNDLFNLECWSLICFINSFWFGLNSTFDSVRGKICNIMALALCVLGCMAMIVCCASKGWKDAGHCGFNFENIWKFGTGMAICFSGAAILLLLNIK